MLGYPLISVAAACHLASLAQSHQNRIYLDALYGFGVIGLREGDSIFGMKVVKPCTYCARTEQKPGRKSCDGCGAPR